MMEIRPTNVGDFEVLRLGALQQNFEPEVLDHAIEHFDDFGDYCWSWIKGDDVFAVFGITPILPGVAAGFAIYGNDALDRPFTLLRDMKAGIGEIMERYQLHRIQTYCSIESKHFRRMNEILGFEVEGIMESYPLPGQDTYLMARVRDGN